MNSESAALSSSVTARSITHARTRSRAGESVPTAPRNSIAWQAYSNSMASAERIKRISLRKCSKDSGAMLA